MHLALEMDIKLATLQCKVVLTITLPLIIGFTVPWARVNMKSFTCLFLEYHELFCVYYYYIFFYSFFCNFKAIALFFEFKYLSSVDVLLIALSSTLFTCSFQGNESPRYISLQCWKNKGTPKTPLTLLLNVSKFQQSVFIP